MDRPETARKLMSFLSDDLDSVPVLDLPRTGIGEKLLVHFGLDDSYCDSIYPYHIKEFRLKNLKILREFMLNEATEEQLIFANGLIKVNKDIDINIDASSDLSGKVFVATLMNPNILKKDEYKDYGIAVEDIHNGLKKGISDTNNDFYFVNEDEHTDNISLKILEEIRNCKFIVADLTCQNLGVYYESGYAKALGKTIIYTCYDKDFTNIHFDIKQINTIRWSNLDDLAEKLSVRINSVTQ